jgi:hypothetical protein
VDGTDGDILWNDSENDGNFRSVCVKDEGTEWYRQTEPDMLCVVGA